MIVALSLLGLYILILLGVAWFSMHPVRSPLFISPAAMGVPQIDVEFPSTDGTVIRGWWLDSPAPKAAAVLSHGYLMSRSELTPLAVTLVRHGISCLLIDLRAHGK